MDLINSTLKTNYDNIENSIRKLRKEMKQIDSIVSLLSKLRIHYKKKVDKLKNKIIERQRIRRHHQARNTEESSTNDATFEKLYNDYENVTNQYFSAAKFGKLILEDYAMLFKKIKKLKKEKAQMRKKCK